MKKESKVPIFNQYEAVSPDTKLLEKRRKMYEIHEAFEAEKDSFRQKEMGFQKEQEQIKQKDKEFQQNMTKFCQFSQQNEIKKKKAEQRAELEEKTYIEKQAQIGNLLKEIKQLKKNQKRYQHKVSHLRKYEQYLEKVRTTYNDQYPEMADILNRYQTLKKSSDDLISTREKLQSEHDILKKQSLNIEKQLNHEILRINNKSKQLSRQIEQRLKQKNEIQSEIQRSNQQFSNKNLNMGKIFMAINNLHFRCEENSLKLKHDFDEKVMAEKKIQKKKDTENAQNNYKQDDQANFQQKAKAAALKLKTIVSHMKDFKAIIDLYKAAKPEKGDR